MNSTRRLLWFEITTMLTAFVKNKSVLSFIVIFGTLSFPTGRDDVARKTESIHNVLQRRQDSTDPRQQVPCTEQ